MYILVIISYLLAFCTLVLSLDLLLATHLEKKEGLYPCLYFVCLCGFTKDLRIDVVRTSSLYFKTKECICHTQTCLLYLIKIKYDYTLYWGVSAAKAQLDGSFTDTLETLLKNLSKKDREKKRY